MRGEKGIMVEGRFVPIAGIAPVVGPPPETGSRLGTVVKAFDAAAQVLGPAAPHSVTLRTNLTPDLTFDLEAASRPREEPAGTGGKLVELFLRKVLNPQLEVRVAGQPVLVHPWGPPSGSGKGALIVGGAVAVAAAVGLGYWLARRETKD